MTDHNWGWYASADEENYICGPEATRDAIIQAATDDELGLWDDDATGASVQAFHIMEAWQSPILLADHFGAAAFLEGVNDELSEFGSEDGTPMVDLSTVAEASLERVVRDAIAKWQADNNLHFHKWIFSGTRNRETIVLPASIEVQP